MLGDYREFRSDDIGFTYHRASKISIYNKLIPVKKWGHKKRGVKSLNLTNY